MSHIFQYVTEERVRSFFLFVLFVSIPFSIAGDDFAISGLYLCVIYLQVKKRAIPIKSKISYGIGLMLLGAVLSSAMADDPIAGFGYFRAFWRLGLPFLIYCALRDHSIHPWLRILLIVSFLMSVYAVVQFFYGVDIFRSQDLTADYLPVNKTWHAVGAFSHHLTYGGVSLLLFALFTPPMFDASLSVKNRILFGSGALGNLTVVVLCLGRSIWLGAIIAVGTMILLKLRIKTLGLVLVLAGIGFAVYSGIDAQTKDEFFRKTTIGRRIISINPQDNIDRIMMYTAALDIIKDHPLLGLGPASGNQMQPYYDRLAKEQNFRFQHRAAVGVHNIYLQTWIDFGLLGLIGYLVWWLILFKEIGQALKATPALGNGTESLLTGLFAGFVGFMAAGFFENNFRDGEVQTTLLTFMGIALVLIDKKNNLLKQSPGTTPV